MRGESEEGTEYKKMRGKKNGIRKKMGMGEEE